MDINYLLWLQNFRESTHNMLTPFMQWLSGFSVSYLILLPAFLYWCRDKKGGVWTLASLYVSMALTTVIKLTACVSRPFVKDLRIDPAVKSLPKSYSFPSRHAAMATPMYLGPAVIFWHKHISRTLSVLCVLLAILAGFSRNYLGVHTFVDVLGGVVLSIVCMCLVKKAGNYFDKYPEKENQWLVLTALLCVLAFVYILYKPYPVEYINGKLAANPHKMFRDAFENIGALLAFCAARYIEKTWIRFEVPGFNAKGILYGIAGLIPLCLLIAFGEKALIHLLGPNWGRFTGIVCLVFYIIALYPFVLKCFCNKKETA